LVPGALLLCALTAGCRNLHTSRTYQEALPPRDLNPTIITYVEQDAFDAVFESALVNQDPVILIQTSTTRPDWGPRLNAWIAAWNRGGKAAAEQRGTVRLQAPVTINGDTLREFRLLVDDLMKHVDELARRGSSWWAEERTQRRRIALLRAYSLHFHMDANGNIQLIFFNGTYAPYYRRFMDTIAERDADEPAEWSRCVKCSCCKHSTAPMARPTARALLELPVGQVMPASQSEQPARSQ
jgi:hypothetical protein